MAAHALMSQATDEEEHTMSNREPLHTFRAPDPLWSAAQEVAAGNGEALSAVIRRALEAYVAEGVKQEATS